MDVSLLIPWRHVDEPREVALAWVLDRYADTFPEWQIVLGAAPDGPWCKAAAVADGLLRCDGDLLVVADADVWCDDVGLAAAAVENGAAWAMPHRMVHRLTAEATAAAFGGGPMGGATVERPYIGWPGGGIVALRRSSYDIAPMDPRFLGWGHEDESWSIALDALVGRGWRGVAPLWHFWHPPQPRLRRGIGSKESEALAHQYRSNRKQAHVVRALIEEAKAWQPFASSSTSEPSATS